jgi:hypothetical protein
MDSFDFIQCEEDSGYEAYQAQLEVQQYLDSDEFIDDLNKELSMIANSEKELNAVDIGL